MISESNEKLDKNPHNENLKRCIGSDIYFINTLLGFGGKNPNVYFGLGSEVGRDNRIEELIEKRLIAKKNKDYGKADEIRDLLKMDYNVQIMDTPNGTEWEYIT